MLEILFTESAAGGLKYARNYGKGKYKAPADSPIYHRIVERNI